MDSLPQTPTAQQFCLRWHNHQASLLSSLPLLLDQSHLTDVTLSADGKTVRAHRVVLSACSTFFSELFRTLEPPLHPVIVLPGASFPSVIALLTFMYSGEVNVFEEQINNLLSLAETLGIKGLADFNGNVAKSPKNYNESSSTAPSTPTSTTSSSALPVSAIATQSNKENEKQHNLHQLHYLSQQQQQQHPTIPSPILDNFFTRPLNFYHHLIPQPINFSTVSPTLSSSSSTACNRTPTIVPNFFPRFPIPQNNHLLSKTTINSNNTNIHTNTNNNNNNCNNNINDNRLLINDDYNSNNNNNNTDDNNITSCNNKKQILNKNTKKIDKIAENLRCATSNKNYMENLKQSIIVPHSPPTSMLLKPITQPFPPPHHFLAAAAAAAAANSSVDDCLNMRKTPDSLSSFDVAAQLQLTGGGNGGGGVSSITNHSMTNNINNNNNIHENINMEQSLDKIVNCSSSGISTNTSSPLSLPSGGSGGGGGGGGTGGGGGNSGSGGVSGNITTTKTPNSKLYATCFICNKQLSNQYNLRVHLETHQNVRYACTVCSHVSRSKDALRKHVSYRHPGTPSPCESETRRKRVKTINNNNNNSNNLNNNNNISPIKNETVPNNNNNNNSNDPCKTAINYQSNQPQSQLEQTLSPQNVVSQSSILSTISPTITSVTSATKSTNTTTTNTTNNSNNTNTNNTIAPITSTSSTTIISNLPPNNNPPIKLEINSIKEKIIDSSTIV